MSEIKSIYVAGKMQEDGWRLALFDHGYDFKYDSQLRIQPYMQVQEKLDQKWPDYSEDTVCGLRYTGPFFVDLLGGHGYNQFLGDEHGSNIRASEQGYELDEQRKDVQSYCFDAIERADLIFAWIDGTDCYGTIAEIGYARALGKIIWIASPRKYDDLWFIYCMADKLAFFPPVTRKSMVTVREYLEAQLENYRKNHPHFDSPIEEAFWDAWHNGLMRVDYELVPQFSIGKYYVDFAHISTMTVIELDGFASHSSTDDIAKDRKRQREIEEQGWHVIRFGGKEIHNNIAECVREAWMWVHKKLKEKET